MAMGVVERCDECGFDASELSAPDAIADIAVTPDRWKSAIAGLTGEEIAARPGGSGAWSIADHVEHARGVVYSMQVILLVAIGQLAEHRDELVAPPSPGGEDVIDIRSSWEKLRTETERFVTKVQAVLSNGWDDEVAVVEGEELSVPTVLRRTAHDLRHSLAQAHHVRELVASRP